MIEGLTVTVAGKELVTLCKDRVIHHLELVKAYQEQIILIKQEEGFSAFKVAEMENRVMRHEYEAEGMQFLADHIDASETYVLHHEDLLNLGIKQSRY